VIPLSLHEREARIMEYFQRADLQLSDFFKNVMSHAFGNADALCSTLALWACDACGGDSKDAMPVAAALECLHRFAYLHDELQALDPVHRENTLNVWGLAQTLNAGDAFHGLALRMLAAESATPERVLAVAVMLEELMLRGIEARNRLAMVSRSGRSRGRRRVIASLTQPLALAASLRAGAMMAGAPEEQAAALHRAGFRLGLAAALALARYDLGTSEIARSYAVKAIAEIEVSRLPRLYVQEFEEIAYQLATGD
jgi:geranylgeranyl pyrophosphate synthase